MEAFHDLTLSLLRCDTDKVLRILQDEQGPRLQFDEVYAYLEAHMFEPNRVQIVVEELLGMTRSRSPSPEIRQVDPNPSQGFTNKGKGLGKNSDTSKRNLSSGAVSPSSNISKKIKLEETASGSSSSIPSEVKREDRDSRPTQNHSQELQDRKVDPSSASAANRSPSRDADLEKMAAVKTLASSLVAMFPDTPRGYIEMRCTDLVGKEAAIERFTEELLVNPEPPENWKYVFKNPFSTVQDSVITETGRALQPPAMPPANAGIPGTSTSQTEAGNPTSGPEIDPEVRWEMEKNEGLVSMFPELCPDYLHRQVRNITNPTDQDRAATQSLNKLGVLDSKFDVLVDRMFAMTGEERSKLPTRSQWEKKIKQKKEVEKWTSNMSVNDMLLLYSDDPAGYFQDPERKPESELYKQHAIEGLKKEFRFDFLYDVSICNTFISRFHSVTIIRMCFRMSNSLYLPALKLLETYQKERKTPRPNIEIRFPTEPSIEFLKEKKFMELEEQIKAEKEARRAEREAKIKTAKLMGTLKECLCCYSSDCLSEEMIQCKSGHFYCKECITRGASVAIGDGKTVIECLGHCSEEIVWQELQKVLTPNVLSKLLQRRQAEEVGAAELDNLVTCPFCPYLTIMDNPDDRVLLCRNPECGRDSCRLCKEPNHVPLRCDEVEKKDEERKKIEEQLSQAMMRECWKCKVRYFKEEGCNKMTCPQPGCGAKMCYLCKEPVKDYTHFYGQGGTPDKTRVCPLWTDTKKLHEQEVADAAAKAEEERKKPTVEGTVPADGGNPIGTAPEAPRDNRVEVENIRMWYSQILDSLRF